MESCVPVMAIMAGDGGSEVGMLRSGDGEGVEVDDKRMVIIVMVSEI